MLSAQHLLTPSQGFCGRWCPCPGVTGEEPEVQRRGTGQGHTELGCFSGPVPPRPWGRTLSTKPLPAGGLARVLGGPLTPPGEVDGSPQRAQPLERVLVQLLSDVQMLHLQEERPHSCPPVPPKAWSQGPLKSTHPLPNIGHPFLLSLRS